MGKQYNTVAQVYFLFIDNCNTIAYTNASANVMIIT